MERDRQEKEKREQEEQRKADEEAKKKKEAMAKMTNLHRKSVLQNYQNFSR